MIVGAGIKIELNSDLSIKILNPLTIGPSLPEPNHI